MNFLYKIAILVFLISPSSFATHLAGGEIRATFISAQTYKISVLLYLDNQNSSASPTEIKVCMGDGNIITIPKSSTAPLTNSPGIVLSTFEKNYTFPSSGIFQISVSESNRTGSLNFTNASESVFFIWTVLSTQLTNSTPVMPNLNFSAGVRQVFSVDLKATGNDTDSISVRLQKLSKPSPGTCGVRSIDQTYIYPNDVSKSGTFKIDRAEKKLVWTAPEKVGNYSYAMIVDEWRDGVKISETYREGMINVTDKPGETTQIPVYQYAEAGDLITSLPNLDSPEVSIAVEAYPVPTEDFVTVKAYSKRQAIIKLQLIDIQGRVVREVKTQAPSIVFQEQFDLRNLSKGVYIIRAGNETETVSQKILR